MTSTPPTVGPVRTSREGQGLSREIGRSLLYELLADGEIESIHVGRLRHIRTAAPTTYIDQERLTTPRSVPRGLAQ